MTNPHELKCKAFQQRGFPATLDMTSRDSFIKNGWPLDVYEQVCEEVNVHILEEVPLVDGIESALLEIEAAAIQIFVVTARYHSECLAACAYMERRELPVAGVFPCARKSKSPILKALRPCMFVDDSVYQLRRLASEVSCKLFLFENGANKNIDMRGLNVTRVSGGWLELKRLVLAHTEKDSASAFGQH